MDKSLEIAVMEYKLIKRNIYGSAQVGICKDTVDLNITNASGALTQATNYHARQLNHRQYSLSNHLGNVLTTLGDGKAPVDSNSDGVIDYYVAYIISASDYSPFGVELANRTWSVEEYRNGFQKQESDKELWEGAMNYKYRVEDPRLGRFFSVDPLYAKYPYNSNYAFSENVVINAVELEGLEKIYSIEGKSLGKVGTKDNMMIVDNELIWNSYANGKKGKEDLNNLMNHTKECFEENKLTWMLQNWGNNNIQRGKSIELGLIIFQGAITENDGSQKKVLIFGNTVTDGEKEHVKIDNSFLYIGNTSVYKTIRKDILNSTQIRMGNWRPYVGVHTHPSGSYARREFSNEDFGWSLSNKIPLFMIAYDERVLNKFDPFKYMKVTRHKYSDSAFEGDASFDKEALMISISKYYIFDKYEE